MVDLLIPRLTPLPSRPRLEGKTVPDQVNFTLTICVPEPKSRIGLICANNPICNIDPLGLDTLTVLGGDTGIPIPSNFMTYRNYAIGFFSVTLVASVAVATGGASLTATGGGTTLITGVIETDGTVTLAASHPAAAATADVFVAIGQPLAEGAEAFTILIEKGEVTMLGSQSFTGIMSLSNAAKAALALWLASQGLSPGAVTTPGGFLPPTGNCMDSMPAAFSQTLQLNMNAGSSSSGNSN